MIGVGPSASSQRSSRRLPSEAWACSVALMFLVPLEVRLVTPRIYTSRQPHHSALTLSMRSITFSLFASTGVNTGERCQRGRHTVLDLMRRLGDAARLRLSMYFYKFDSGDCPTCGEDVKHGPKPMDGNSYGSPTSNRCARNGIALTMLYISARSSMDSSSIITSGSLSVTTALRSEARRKATTR